MFSRIVSKSSVAGDFLGYAIVALPCYAPALAGVTISENSDKTITLSSTGDVAYGN
jgi:hypothetical protein